MCSYTLKFQLSILLYRRQPSRMNFDENLLEFVLISRNQLLFNHWYLNFRCHFLSTRDIFLSRKRFLFTIYCQALWLPWSTSSMASDDISIEVVYYKSHFKRWFTSLRDPYELFWWFPSFKKNLRQFLAEFRKYLLKFLYNLKPTRAALK